MLVLIHAHPDHVGGAPFLLRAFQVGETWEGPAPLKDPRYRVPNPTQTPLEQAPEG